MKRSERRLLEEKLRYVAMEDIEYDPEREQQMLKQVRAEFLQQNADPDTKRAKGHGIGRRVILVPAAALLMIVLSFAFTVLTPESVSHARGFVRSAAIWVNRTLKLGFDFEEPVENPSLQESPQTTYSTLHEAAANIPYPLVYFDDSDFALQSVFMQDDPLFSDVVITYRNGSQTCYIKINPAVENTLTSMDANMNTILSWEGGEIVCWEGDPESHAFAYYSGMEIDIRGFDITYDRFLALCQTLRAFN